MLCGVARSSQLSQRHAIDMDFVMPCQNSELFGIFIQLHHDATPMLLYFGRLEPYVFEAARYLHKVGGKWTSLTYADYQQTTGRQPCGTRGVLEILGIQLDVSWDTDSGKAEKKAIYLSPIVVKKANASTLYGALDDSLGAFNVDGITALSKTQKCMIILETADRAKYVLKSKRVRAATLPRNVFVSSSFLCNPPFTSYVRTCNA